jgi:iduronate 2-sulfatase
MNIEQKMSERIDRRFSSWRCRAATLGLVLWVFVVCAPFAFGQRTARRAKPNVLFIAIDDLRPQLGAYGDRVVKSPNLDRLAARGMVFERAYVQQALCSPSRISLLSGLRPATTGIYTIGPTLRSKVTEVTTLPQLFKNNGWFTRSLGKVFHVGIDDPDSWSVPSWQSNKPRYGPAGTALVEQRQEEFRRSGKPIPETGGERPFYAGPAFEAPEVADEALLDGDTAREAVAALRALTSKPDQPFFLAVGFANPHVPWVAPKKYWDLYQPETLPMATNQFTPKNAPEFAATTGADFYWYGNVPKDRRLSPEFKRQCLHGYLAAISYIDAQVGRVLAALEASGQADNTIVFLWGDHGYYMGEHSWWGGKHNNYEGATRAPLIVAVPGAKTAGQRTNALVEFVDLYPTLAELAGLSAPATIEGTSFAPLLKNPKLPWKRAAFSQYPRGGNRLGTAMRTDRYRYVEWVDKDGALIGRELYDHRTDPQENENIAEREENAALVISLSDELRAGWKAAVPEARRQAATR